MLPDPDTAERQQLHVEALWFARRMLDVTHGDIHKALARTCAHFHRRFLDEDYGDQPPTASEPEWLESFLDAKQLQAFVSDCWVGVIKSQYAAVQRFTGA